VTGALAILGGMLLLSAIILALGVLSAGCRNTANGVRADTKKVLHKTGHGVQKAGKKIENAGK
jgi:predicted small secreted protein